MSCSSQTAVKDSQRIPLCINDVEIAHQTIAMEVQNHPSQRPVEAWQAASRALAVREILLQEAKRLEIKPEPTGDSSGRTETSDEALIRQLIAAQITTPNPDDETCHRYYQQNRKRFETPALYEVAHILLGASTEDQDLYAQRSAEAKEIIEALNHSPRAFAALARQYSDCPSSKEGGSLGQITPGQTTPEFEVALTTMQPGEISSTPVETRYGFHIILLQRKVDGTALPFEVVKERISEYLSDKVKRIAIAQYIARLVSAARISGVAMPDAQHLRVF